jgi:hypothetical protein
MMCPDRRSASTMSRTGKPGGPAAQCSRARPSISHGRCQSEYGDVEWKTNIPLIGARAPKSSFSKSRKWRPKSSRARILSPTFLEGLRHRLPEPSRNQKQYQEAESEEQKQKPSALRAAAANDTLSKPNARLIAIARDVISEAPRNTDLDYLVDAFQSQCLQHRMETNRTAALAALSAAQGVVA